MNLFTKIYTSSATYNTFQHCWLLYSSLISDVYHLQCICLVGTKCRPNKTFVCQWWHLTELVKKYYFICQLILRISITHIFISLMWTVKIQDEDDWYLRKDTSHNNPEYERFQLNSLIYNMNIVPCISAKPYTYVSFSIKFWYKKGTIQFIKSWRYRSNPRGINPVLKGFHVLTIAFSIELNVSSSAKGDIPFLL